MKRVVRTLVVIAALGAAACGPRAAPGSQSGEASSSQPGRTLVLVAQAEPVSMAAKSIRDTGGRRIGATLRLFNAGLAILDERQVAHPYLTEALPELGTDSWRLLPDGHMETIYRLKPSLTWQDGAPLSADDFVFANRVYSMPEFGVANIGALTYLEDVSAPDPRTVVLRWRQPFPGAGTVVAADFQALPRHILQAAFEPNQPDAFVAQPFWGSEYVGLGPYRIERWEPGAFIEATAFAGHALGRPRIDRIRLLFVSDPNTAVADLLAGQAQATVDDPIRLQQAIILKREWEQTQGGNVLLSEAQVRWHQLQLKPEFANPRGLLDLRVRKALAHAVDRQALLDGLLEGQGTIAHTLISPRLDYYRDVDRAIAKYPYDPRRTEQLMNEAGLIRGADGVFARLDDGRFAPEVRINAAGQNEAEATIMADSLRRAGMDATVYVIPQALTTDAQFRASFPSLTGTGSELGGDPPLGNLSASEIPSAENRWRGSNRGGWVNTEFERLNGAYASTLDRSASNQLVLQMMKVVSEELPALPLYYNVGAQAYSADLRGPLLSASTAGAVWNIHEWELR
jgi:peptide/nickel transport system substrate-binding protein